MILTGGTSGTVHEECGMSGFGGWAKVLTIAGAALTVTACASYPVEPRYSTRADQPSAPGIYPLPGNAGQQPAQPYPGQPYQAPVTPEAPPPSTAPIGEIEGGSLPSATITSGLNGGPVHPTPVRPAPVVEAPTYSPPPYSAPVSAGGGVAYVIQPGDTLSGVGRRFQTPVQSLIDLNNLGPRGAITAGQRITLPDAAVDTGADPYATGPAPIGVVVPRGGSTPPPPALPPATRPVQTAQAPAPVPSPAPVRPTPAPATSTPPAGAAIALQWPVRGDVVRPFGPVSLGERNNGINIGAPAGAVVSAAAAGRVAYVGDALVGQGLTVLIVHRDGWRTVYGHLGSATVDDGADVRAGQQVGTVGLTAGDGRPSMHFETRRMQGDNPVAVDPLTVLPR
jgi:murein DD-endopeptidase MepM/ murein hydrolase activator NlpD